VNKLLSAGNIGCYGFLGENMFASGECCFYEFRLDQDGESNDDGVDIGTKEKVVVGVSTPESSEYRDTLGVVCSRDWADFRERE